MVHGNEEIFRIRMDGAGCRGLTDFAWHIYVFAPRQSAHGDCGDLWPDCTDYRCGRHPDLYQAGKIYRLCAFGVPDFRYLKRDVRLYAFTLSRCRQVDIVPVVSCLVHCSLHFPPGPRVHNSHGGTKVFLLFCFDCQYSRAGSGYFDVFQSCADLYDHEIHGVCGGGLPDFAGN